MHPVTRKLSIFASFSAEEAKALELAFANVVTVPSRMVVAREEEPPTSILFLLDGFLCRQKLLATGRGQILSFLLPGDACDVGVGLLERRDHSLVAMTASRLARVSDASLEHLMQEYPKVRAALQWATLQEEGIAREWIVNVGQRSALMRLAHVVCEVYHRFRVIGLAEPANFPLPLTQAELGDALGISAVHVNRTLQQLRMRRLIAFGDKLMTILDLPGLEELAEFDPTYLHLEARYRATAWSAKQAAY